MSTRLEAVAAIRGTRRRHRSGLRLANEAAQLALRRAGRRPIEVDLLLNAGLYHDGLLGEPALAAIIQDDIDANREDPSEDAGEDVSPQGTFSFDIANGACGMLTALQVADGFLAAGTIDHALVVASDADPGRRLAPAFPYRPAGAALLCAWDDGPGGLSGIRFASRPVDDGGMRAIVGFEGGRNRLAIEEGPAFLPEAATLAAAVACECVEQRGLAVRDVDLVVASPLRQPFLDDLARLLGVPADRVVRVRGGAETHTAALGLALDAAQHSPAWAAARTVLLVSAGAGLLAGAALLHPHG